jgi:Tfp pilus assembly protein PilV
MNKRGVVLIFALLVVLVLTVLLGAFYFKSISEKQMAMRYVNSSRAFWLAETGVAMVKSNPGLSSASGSLVDPSYTYNATVNHITGNYYSIASVGTVTLPDASSVRRTVTATVRTGSVDPSKFKYGIETTTDLKVTGSAEINPSNSWKEYATIDFNDRFSVSKAEMEAGATHVYTPSNFGASGVDGITWVNVPSGTTMNITGNLVGSGILVVNGNVKFAGTVQFYGIIYVIGELTMRGTIDTFGCVLAESTTTVDTSVGGNAEINYDIAQITNALANVQFLSKQIVSWRES